MKVIYYNNSKKYLINVTITSFSLNNVCNNLETSFVHAEYWILVYKQLNSGAATIKKGEKVNEMHLIGLIIV